MKEFIENEDLVIEIYKSAAKDYVKAIISEDEFEKEKNEKFLTSGAYQISTKTGVFIVNKLQEEIRIARNIINSFLANDLEEIYLNQRKVVVWVLKMIVDIKHSNECEVICKHGENYHFYLVKKPLKMA